MDIVAQCVRLCALMKVSDCMKKLIICLCAVSILTAITFSSCGSDNKEDTIQPENNTIASSTEKSDKTEIKTENKTEKKSDNKSEKVTQSNKEGNIQATENYAPTENGETVIDKNAHDNYNFVDETVTNPTVAPYENSDNNQSNDFNLDTLKGEWKADTVLNVSDQKEISIAEAFGSAYSQDELSLNIQDNGKFTISLGSLIKDGQDKGTFNISGNNLVVTYSDGSPDTFLYIPKFQNKDAIKLQINNFYVYFIK